MLPLILYTPPLTNNKHFRGSLVAIVARYNHQVKKSALLLVPVVTNARKLATFQQCEGELMPAVQANQVDVNSINTSPPEPSVHSTTFVGVVSTEGHPARSTEVKPISPSSRIEELWSRFSISPKNQR